MAQQNRTNFSSRPGLRRQQNRIRVLQLPFFGTQNARRAEGAAEKNRGFDTPKNPIFLPPGPPPPGGEFTFIFFSSSSGGRGVPLPPLGPAGQVGTHLHRTFF